MVKSSITFIHGWGCGPNIWATLIDHLSNFQCQTVNLGFSNNQENSQPTIPKASVYVTHSLGTMWALKNKYENMSALIAINGFASFKSFTQPHILKRMKIGLKRDAQAQMNDFWKASDLPKSDALNMEQLYNGLNWLETWDYTQALAEISCPVTAIFSDNDKILDIDLMRKHWQSHSYSVVENAGHALPVTHAQQCADMIRKTINAL